MDVQRAQDIISSSTMETVTCDGVAIYMKSLDAKNEMVTIYPLGQPHNERQVHLSSLRQL